MCQLNLFQQMYYNIHGYAAEGERESEAFASYFEDIFLPEFEFDWWEEVGRNELYYYLDQLDDNLKMKFLKDASEYGHLLSILNSFCNKYSEVHEDKFGEITDFLHEIFWTKIQSHLV